MPFISHMKTKYFTSLRLPRLTHKARLDSFHIKRKTQEGNKLRNELEVQLERKVGPSQKA